MIGRFILTKFETLSYTHIGKTTYKKIGKFTYMQKLYSAVYFFKGKTSL